MNRELKSKVNHMLMSRGLGRLEDGAGLVSQLGFLVRDDAHFSQLLAACDPPERRNMYESLRPYLRFEARPFEDYLIEARRDAEARQLPIVGEDGLLHPYSPPELRSRDADLVSGLVAESVAKQRLTVVCRKCTREQTFSGMTKADAIQRLRDEGWTYDEIGGKGFEICPECPAVRIAA